MSTGIRWLAACTWLLGALGACSVHAAELVIVVDDLGYSLERAERLLALPVPVTLSLLPFAPATRSIAERAASAGREIILHQPMEALAGPAAPDTLLLAMTPDAFDALLERAIADVPGAIGVNNHTGSLLTQHDEPMHRLMSRLADHGLLFLDSRTTDRTVAYRSAVAARIPALERDVFLDHAPDHAAMAAELARALAIARRKGYAIVIAHPYDATLRFLEQTLGALPDDVTVVTLQTLIRSRRATLVQHESPANPHRSPGQ